ncbi:DUF4145 domain-containing protein [Rhodoferax sp. BLA1]|uniref:DUF4145 domain-containing protein n=1 Tax=Rhodoferax sp. BLA1 TaxID=2576062 RepID=UPI0015D2A133|nr:DUF4145 domain-containing protein [Rhodoferax sp. BLA1]
MNHGNQLELDRCPHCNVAKPLLGRQWAMDSADHGGRNKRFWSVFKCVSCGGLVMGSSPSDQNHAINQIWPSPQTVANEVPVRARNFLSQAIASLHAPAGAVMLTASAVDAMLKDKGLKEGSLNSRIDAAAKNHLITAEMAAWAHEIRLDANDQRHADEEAELPDGANAAKAIEFANALAQFLYVLPARVERGRKA